jgi:carbamoyltransferase
MKQGGMMSSEHICVGIHDGHNAAVAAMVDGEIVWAAQEERLSRVKNDSGFPSRALARMFEDLNLAPDKVHRYVFNGLLVPYGPSSREENILAYKAVSSKMAKIKGAMRKTPLYQWHIQRRKRERLAAAAGAGLPTEKCTFLEHHLAHAASAYFGSGWKEGKVLVLTADGSGDGVCATVNVAENGCIRRLARVSESESVGILWALVTAYMGMVPLEHEYKLMGMAPYSPEGGAAKVKKVFWGAFAEDPANPLTWRRANGVPEINNSYEYFRARLEFCRFDWVCAGLQEFTEDFIVSWVSRCIAETGVRSLALSGGLFMNVKMNKRIMELPEVERLFIVPSCGDESNVFGLCYQVSRDAGKGDAMPPLGHVYLGPHYGNEACAETARRLNKSSGISIRECVDIEQEVAALLAKGEIVARYKGREEFGARALGNRSILADPSRNDVVQIINKMIKCRDFWMPFACSILEEDADTYVENPKKIAAPYMIMTFDSKRTDDIRAGSHPEDKTVRPQMVTQSHNPDYHRLIREFKRLTGRGAVLNTSFNLHGFPIVSSPDDAAEVFLKSGLGHLALGDYLLSKGPPK